MCQIYLGLSIGALSAIILVYHSKIAETKLRRRIITLQQWAFLTGISTSFWVNDGITVTVDNDLTVKGVNTV